MGGGDELSRTYLMWEQNEKKWIFSEEYDDTPLTTPPQSVINSETRLTCGWEKDASIVRHWPQIAADNNECVSHPNQQIKHVDDQMACQEEAVKNGHKYYQYAPDSGMCLTGTKQDWKIYRQPTPM